ncbi:hypothetical protein P3T35_003063 [Kitasatospora sp. GP30]|uniref:hypothetical protein n=1 Tax=Kitasatospora sp. GP30 TaxID=3035084 RepID=UPI000C704E54|nr:hypothetical protein [Kitasatospora sp. GP30]MDH6141050.1 hypothetical protein [Kitasatospora sp. GP30]
MNTFEQMIATAQDQAARYLAADITYRTAEIQDALINQLESISQAAGRRASDQLVTAAVARLSPRTSEMLYHRACQTTRYAAARLIARTTGLGDELYQQAHRAERQLLAAYVRPSGQVGGAE